MSIFFGKQLKAKPAMRSAHFPCGTGILFDPTSQVLLRKSQREVYHILKSPACTCFWITFPVPFHCRSELRCERLAHRAHRSCGGCPAVSPGIVSPAGVQM